MTREELAKKKGIKVKETTQTAAEAFITSIAEKKEDIKEEPKAEPKKRAGKPKTKAETPNKIAENKTSSKEEKSTPKAGRPKGKPSFFSRKGESAGRQITSSRSKEARFSWVECSRIF